jgi:CRISPR-associated protein Csh2
MTDPFTYRHEMLFFYEAVDCNPNGDPLDENRPRTDPMTGVCTVSDVRIKRTIRDEILSWEPDESKRIEAGREILIRDTYVDDGSLATGKDRADAFGKVSKKPKATEVRAIQDKVLAACIDARLFGSTLPIGGKGGEGESGASLKLTGAVQWSAFNRSLHRVSPQFVQMTAAFAGKSGASQKSFAERHLLPYAAIAAFGVGNPAAARSTRATDEDLADMLTALWQGTNNLATTSKMGHASLLLVDVVLASGTIGRLDRRVRLNTRLDDETIRSTDDYTLDVGALVETLEGAKDRLVTVKVLQDDRLRTSAGDTVEPLVSLLEKVGLTPEALG